MTDLNKRQRAWLRFHSGDPPVHRHAWLDRRRVGASGDPEGWVYLRAWRKCDPWRLETCTIHRDDRAALEGLYDPATWTITDLGRQALEATDDQT